MNPNGGGGVGGVRLHVATRLCSKSGSTTQRRRHHRQGNRCLLHRWRQHPPPGEARRVDQRSVSQIRPPVRGSGSRGGGCCWWGGSYLRGLRARLLQQLHRSPPRRLLAPPIVPGQVPPRPAPQLVLDVLGQGPVLHGRPAEAEAGRRCGDERTGEDGAKGHAPPPPSHTHKQALSWSWGGRLEPKNQQVAPQDPVINGTVNTDPDGAITHSRQILLDVFEDAYVHVREPYGAFFKGPS